MGAHTSFIFFIVFCFFFFPFIFFLCLLLLLFLLISLLLPLLSLFSSVLSLSNYLSSYLSLHVGICLIITIIRRWSALSRRRFVSRVTQILNVPHPRQAIPMFFFFSQISHLSFMKTFQGHEETCKCLCACVWLIAYERRPLVINLICETGRLSHS